MDCQVANEMNYKEEDIQSNCETERYSESEELPIEDK